MDVNRRVLQRKFMTEGDPVELERILREAVRAGEFAEVLHANRDAVLHLLPSRETTIDPSLLDDYLYEFWPEMNLERLKEQYDQWLVAFDRCHVTHPGERGPSITRGEKEYPAPTFDDVQRWFTVDKLRRIAALPEPRQLELIPFALPIKEFAERVTSMPGALPYGQNPISTNWDLDADRPDRKEGQTRIDYCQNLKNQQWKIKDESIEQEIPSGWIIRVGFSGPEMNRDDFIKSREGDQITYKNAIDFSLEFAGKDHNGDIPEVILARHAKSLISGVPYDQDNWNHCLNARLTGKGFPRSGDVPGGFWDPFRGLRLGWDGSVNASDNKGARPAV